MFSGLGFLLSVLLIYNTLPIKPHLSLCFTPLTTYNCPLNSVARPLLTIQSLHHYFSIENPSIDHHHTTITPRFLLIHHKTLHHLQIAITPPLFSLTTLLPNQHFCFKVPSNFKQWSPFNPSASNTITHNTKEKKQQCWRNSTLGNILVSKFLWCFHAVYLLFLLCI